MSQNIKCIVCGKYAPGTEEHIIPKSMGNSTLKTWSVCKLCNSNLGTFVDNYLVNHIITKIIRNYLGLKGQSGKIPNPFEKGVDENGRIIYTDENFKPQIAPFLEENDNKIHVSAPTKDSAKKMVSKKLERLGIVDEEIQKVLETDEKAQPNSFRPQIKYDCTIDFNKIHLEFIKIAYEYACLKLGDEYCWHDNGAKAIREILTSAIDGNFEITHNLITKMPDEILHLIQKIPNSDKTHFIYIHEDQLKRVLVQISLFSNPLFSFSVCVSKNSEKFSKTLQNIDMDMITVF